MMGAFQSWILFLDQRCQQSESEDSVKFLNLSKDLQTLSVTCISLHV